MAITTTIGLFLGGATALDSLVQGRSMTNEALRGLEEFEAQKLVNNYEGLSPSLDAEFTALSGFSEQQAGAVDVAQNLNAADALAIMSTSQEQIGKQRLDMYNQMRKEQRGFDVMTAQEEGVIRTMQEERDRFRVQTLQEQLAAGQEMKYQALEGVTKGLIGVGMAKEDRLAGLGIDPIAARKQRITDGEATYQDYLNEGMFKDAFNTFRGRNEGGDSTATNDLFNEDRFKSGINLYNPDGSFRFPLLSE